MSMIKCPECGKEISDKAISCPNCGCPSNEYSKHEIDISSSIESNETQKQFDKSDLVLRIDLGKTSFIEVRGDLMKVYSSIRNVTDYISNFILLYDKDTVGLPCVRFTHDALSAPIRLEPMPLNKNIGKIRELSSILREKATVKEMNMIMSANYRTDAQKERSIKVHEQLKQEYDNKSNRPINWDDIIERKRTAHCPRCGSTQIAYDTKKLSVGRGVVGGLVGGAAGGPLGEAVGITVGGLSSKKGYRVCLNCGKRWKL